MHPRLIYFHPRNLETWPRNREIEAFVQITPDVSDPMMLGISLEYLRGAKMVVPIATKPPPQPVELMSGLSDPMSSHQRWLRS